MNVSAYNDSNILTALSSSSGNISQSTHGTYYAYAGTYNIWTSHNFTTETQHYMRAGNYSMNFSFHFTPIFEFGPYYVTGNPLNHRNPLRMLRKKRLPFQIHQKSSWKKRTGRMEGQI